MISTNVMYVVQRLLITARSWPLCNLLSCSILALSSCLLTSPSLAQSNFTQTEQSSLSDESLASDKVLRFQMASPDYPPYMIMETGQPPAGIMHDILNEIATKQGYQLKLVQLPRKRVNAMLKSNELDVTARAIEWTRNAQDFVFSDPVIPIEEVLLAPAHQPIVVASLDSLPQIRIGTHLGFKYPKLDPLFNTKKLMRVDAYNEFAMFNILKNLRVDAIIIDDLVGQWMIKNYNWKGEFVRSKFVVDSVDYRFMFAKRWANFVTLFNHELAALKESGKFDAIVTKYR